MLFRVRFSAVSVPPIPSSSALGACFCLVRYFKVDTRSQVQPIYTLVSSYLTHLIVSRLPTAPTKTQRQQNGISVPFATPHPLRRGGPGSHQYCIVGHSILKCNRKKVRIREVLRSIFGTVPWGIGWNREIVPQKEAFHPVIIVHTDDGAMEYISINANNCNVEAF